MPDLGSILTINGGSSSIKFALYQLDAPPRGGLHGKIDRIGLHGTNFAFNDPAARRQQNDQAIGDLDNHSAALFVHDWLGSQVDLSRIATVAHAVVNGGAKYREPHRVTQGLLDEMRRISAYAPEHLPAEIDLIDLISERMPGLPQVAWFELGLLGVSETSSDLRDLLDREASDVRAADAVALFCYQVKKWIGAFAAALGGLDTLIFAGGIGENASVIRTRICAGLGFLGVQFDEIRNAAGEPIISADASHVQVRVIRTDEDVTIAKAVFRMLAGTQTSQHAHFKE